MIISRIVGGLGNQLFQYAIARQIAHKHSEELKLDISAYKTYRRPYFLNNFNIVENILPEDQASHFNRYLGRFSLSRFVESIKPEGKKIYRKEKTHYLFNPEVFKKEPGQVIYLDGYWQNQKYFYDIKDILFRELTLKNEFDIKTKPIYKEINETESVSIHIRRGDDQVNKYLGACSADYYTQCVNEVAQRVENPHLFVFVNEDLEWAKQNLKVGFPVTYVAETGGLTDPQELVAMSNCKHNIIANSTFSWWAAWLNKNPNKLVYAPKKWLKEEIYKTYDFVPEDWNRVEAF